RGRACTGPATESIRRMWIHSQTLRGCEFFSLEARPWMAGREAITQVIDSRERGRACTGPATESIRRMWIYSQTLRGCEFFSLEARPWMAGREAITQVIDSRER